MSKLTEVFTEMEGENVFFFIYSFSRTQLTIFLSVDYNFVGHFYSKEKLLPNLTKDRDASSLDWTKFRCCTTCLYLRFHLMQLNNVRNSPVFIFRDYEPITYIVFSWSWH